MKVTHICLAGPVTDGWNYQDNLLTKYQEKLGYNVSIITSEWIWTEKGKLGKCEKHDYVNADGVRTIRLPMKGKDDFNRKFKKYPALYETLEKLSPDVLFIHGVAFLDTKTIVEFLKKHPTVVAYADNHADFSNSATNWLSKNVCIKSFGSTTLSSWFRMSRSFMEYCRFVLIFSVRSMEFQEKNVSF